MRNPHLQHVATGHRLLLRLAGQLEPAIATILAWHCCENNFWCEAEIVFEEPLLNPSRGPHRVYGSSLATALVEVLA